MHSIDWVSTKYRTDTVPFQGYLARVGASIDVTGFPHYLSTLIFRLTKGNLIRQDYPCRRALALGS